MAVGNYKKKPEKSEVALPNAPAPSSPPTPSKDLRDHIERGLEKDVTDAAPVAERALTFEEILKEEGMTLEEARRIQDELLVNDTYQETFNLTERVTVTFSTRYYQDIVRYHQQLERYQPKYVTERDEITLRYFLAASLVAFRGQSFNRPHPVREPAEAQQAFDERHDFICGLPEPTVNRLNELLFKFDRKVRIALSDGAVEFF